MLKDSSVLGSRIASSLVRSVFILLIDLAILGPISAADMSVREITARLFKAQPGSLNFEAHDLSFLDLSALDFKSANLARSNLLGADLTDSNLRRANLSMAVLDRATIVRTDFSGANLAGAHVRLPHSVGSAAFDSGSSPRFTGANLSESRLVARLDGADFSNAILVNADLSSYGDTTQNTVAQRSVLTGCNFPNAVLREADLSDAILRFANFKNADLSFANLSRADFTRANLAGADLTGANIRGAILDGADLTATKGLEWGPRW